MKLNVQFQEQNETFQSVNESDESIIVDFDHSNNSDEVEVSFGTVQTITRNAPGVTNDYNQLSNRPKINNHLLRGGENSLAQLGIGLSSNTAINRLFS